MTATDADPRRTALEQWARQVLASPSAVVTTASADASFRRYFRVTLPEAAAPAATYIVMDAPPEREDVAPYLHVAELLAQVGLNVPRVLARDAGRGFLLLTDLGTRQYLDELKAGGDAESLYEAALAALATLQGRGSAAARSLPPYDADRLRQEMELLPTWFLERHLDLPVDATTRALLDRTFGLLVEAALRQPPVLVHRDYHSRNLMVVPDHNPGVLDFQDAVRGPATYDVVSLLKDCYIRWPRERVLQWLGRYRELALDAGVPLPVDLAQLVEDFDLMGLQRHIKVLGIFARLYYRDGKRGYLADLPLVFDYVLEVTGATPALAEFDGWLRTTVDPAFRAAQRCVGAPER